MGSCTFKLKLSIKCLRNIIFFCLYKCRVLGEPNNEKQFLVDNLDMFLFSVQIYILLKRIVS